MTGAGAPAPQATLASLLAAVAALAAGAVALLFGPGTLALAVPTPTFLALTHTVTLAYALLAFAGTLQHLLPVLLVTRLAAPWLGRAALGGLALGTAGVVAGFALGFRQLPLAGGGALVTAALWTAAVQGAFTHARTSRADPAARALPAATVYLALTVTLGFLITGARRAQDAGGAVTLSGRPDSPGPARLPDRLLSRCGRRARVRRSGVVAKGSG